MRASECEQDAGIDSGRDLGRNIRNLFGFATDFAKRLLGSYFKSAVAHPLNPEDARKKHSYSFNKLITALGAKWCGNNERDWEFVESENIETCIAMCEFFDDFWIPHRILLGSSEKEF